MCCLENTFCVNKLLVPPQRTFLYLLLTSCSWCAWNIYWFSHHSPALWSLGFFPWFLMCFLHFILTTFAVYGQTLLQLWPADEVTSYMFIFGRIDISASIFAIVISVREQSSKALSQIHFQSLPWTGEGLNRQRVAPYAQNLTLLCFTLLEWFSA